MLAYDNVKKVESRDLIVSTIKEHLPEIPIKMFELLGAGIGIKHYDTNLPLKEVVLVEKNSILFRLFDEKSLSCRVWKHRTDAYTYFDKAVHATRSEDSFNVINLDFCSWFYDNDKPNCTSQIICKMFASKVLADGGLLFLTFMVNGQNLDRHVARTGDDVPCTLGEIGEAVGECARKHGYSLGLKPILTNEYKAGSRRGNQMVNIAFKVKKI